MEDIDDTAQPSTLSEFRETEGSAKRLSHLRRLFDTIPIAAPSPPSSPETVNTALPELEQEERRCEVDRKIYARELWRKCNGHDSPNSSMSLRPPEEQDGQPKPEPAPLPTAAARWNAFERYAEEKEKELWRVFVELDSDGDMHLRRSEVAEACRRAGVQVKDSTLDGFIRAVDASGDGAISFEEWRDFLLVRRTDSVVALQHVTDTCHGSCCHGLQASRRFSTTIRHIELLGPQCQDSTKTEMVRSRSHDGSLRAC